jgi:S-adenosyl-methyltransferase MraW
MSDPNSELQTPVRGRRPRYSGKYPRRFEEKYKERNAQLYPETFAKVVASGKTPAGTHRPLMVKEILEVLDLKPGDTVADCTLGYGGHAAEMLPAIQPEGRLLGLDVDPIEMPRTEQRLRQLGFGPEIFTAHRSNYAGLPQVLHPAGLSGVDALLADLGVSSMQIDDPTRGFSVKFEGPLDMRMNPQRGQPASVFLSRMNAATLSDLLVENADEPRSKEIASVIAGKLFDTTTALANQIRAALGDVGRDEQDQAIRRVFQAIRIAVNDEFSALDTFLRNLPSCLKPGGRAAVLTFHSGEDRRVKKAFQAGHRAGIYSDISEEVLRPTAEERRSNPRSLPAKLRWAKRA